MGSIIIGLVAIALGVFTFILWPWRVLELLQGLTPLALVIIGIVAVTAGMEVLKDKEAAAEEEEEAAE